MARTQRMRGLVATARALALAGAFVSAACVESTKTVFRDRSLTDGVPPAAGGFLGYADTAQHLTVCGNCHVETQARWAQSGHAHAWLTLQESGSAQASCEACHTVNGRGSPLADTATAGYLAVKTTRYHDVQCENCHGPGLNHVQNPTFASAPIATINAGLGLGRGCGDCHNGTHHGFVNEWAQSPHAQVLGPPSGRAECQGCHIAQGALKQFNVRGRYLEQDSTRPLPITCAVCHDPHGSDNAHQLRLPVNTSDETKNLCMRCHNRRGTPDPAAALSGPHAPQTALLTGTAGWWPPNMPVQPGSQILGTHGSAANPNMCATCHVSRFTVTDRATGKFVFQVTGHLFLAIPCLNAQGIPTPDTACAMTQRTFAACTTSGCHGSPAAAQSALAVASQRIATLNATLKGMLARVPASEFSNTDNRYSTAEGAQFDSKLANMDGSVVHNPFLLEALLTGSIQQMLKDYPFLTAPAGVVLTNILPTFQH